MPAHTFTQMARDSGDIYLPSETQKHEKRERFIPQAVILPASEYIISDGSLVSLALDSGFVLGGHVHGLPFLPQLDILQIPTVFSKNRVLSLRLLLPLFAPRHLIPSTKSPCPVLPSRKTHQILSAHLDQYPLWHSSDGDFLRSFSAPLPEISSSLVTRYFLDLYLQNEYYTTTTDHKSQTVRGMGVESNRRGQNWWAAAGTGGS
jgi:hypothetical protein